jgi:hypothetical protein
MTLSSTLAIFINLAGREHKEINSYEQTALHQELKNGFPANKSLLIR